MRSGGKESGGEWRRRRRRKAEEEKEEGEEDWPSTGSRLGSTGPNWPARVSLYASHTTRSAYDLRGGAGGGAAGGVGGEEEEQEEDLAKAWMRSCSCSIQVLKIPFSWSLSPIGRRMPGIFLPTVVYTIAEAIFLLSSSYWGGGGRGGGAGGA